MKTLLIITLFFISTFSIAGPYVSAYTTIKVDYEKHATDNDPSKTSPVIGMVGYRGDKLTIDIATSDFGSPVLSVGVYKDQGNGLRFNGGLTMPEGIKNTVGFYVGADYGYFSARFIKYTSKVDVTNQIDFREAGIRGITNTQTIDRAMFWVGVTHNF